MSKSPEVKTITMEDGEQSIGASRTTYFAALALAEIANNPSQNEQKPNTSTAPTHTGSYSRQNDIAFNCC